MAEQILRQVAYKVYISDILNNAYIVQQGEWEPNYVAIAGKKVSRVNIIANVIDKQDTERLSSAVIDDGSGTISARCFNENTKILRNLAVGDTILLIGKPRKNNNEAFIVAEIAKKLDSPLWLQVRKKELGKEGKDQTAKVQDVSVDETNTARGKILGLIRSLDKGDGALQIEVVRNSGLDIETAEKNIKELLEEGEIYQPKINRLKTIE